jgi:hypothetical protein
VIPLPVVGRLRLDERRAPGVCCQFLLCELGILFQTAPRVGPGAGLHQGRSGLVFQHTGLLRQSDRLDLDGVAAGDRGLPCVPFAFGLVASLQLAGPGLVVIAEGGECGVGDVCAQES